MEVRQPPFEVARCGWGAFNVLVEVHLRQGAGVMRLQHMLCFEGDGSEESSLVPLGLDWSVQQSLGRVGRALLDRPD